MFERPQFKVIYSDEVIEFLNSLDDKVKEKIMRPVRLKSDERRNIISHSALLV